MTLPKWILAFLKGESEIHPKEIIRFIWNLPVTAFIEPPALGSSPVEGNDASLGQAALSSSEERNYLAEGSRVSGKLGFQGPARIDGEFEGEITGTDSVILGDNAVVTAEIKAASIIVAGEFSGEMTISDRVEIRPSARILGNLTQGQVDAQRGSGSGYGGGKVRKFIAKP